MKIFTNLMICLLFPLFLHSQINLGTASSFAVLGSTTVTNTGPSIINGDLGVSPGTAITGFPPGVVNGIIHSNDITAITAQSDALHAYNAAASLTPTTVLTGQDLGGKTLNAGVYFFSSSAGLTGALTLDAQGNPNAQFVFQIGSNLTTASASQVILINGAVASNVFWQVGMSATLGTFSIFEGNILAHTAITVTTGVSSTGSLVALNAAVTLDTNLIDTVPALTISKTHAPASFTIDEQGVYVIIVGNRGTVATSGTITVVDTLPLGLTPVSENGTGWTFSTVGQVVTATTTNSIAAGGDAPPILLLVNVDANAGPILTNTATVSGGGSASVFVADVTPILPLTSPLPPTHFTGRQLKTIFLSQTERFNHLKWSSSESPLVVRYILFRNNKQIDTITGTGPYHYNDHNRHKNQKDVYTLIAVDSNGLQSTPVTTTVPK